MFFMQIKNDQDTDTFTSSESFSDFTEARLFCLFRTIVCYVQEHNICCDVYWKENMWQ